MSSIPATIDSTRFRTALGHYASGITVVTGLDENEPVGFTCQAFHSVSVDPPLISLNVMRTSTSFPRLRESGRFAVNVLAHDQDALSSRFARSGGDKWSSVATEAAESGNPVLTGTVMWLDCEIWREFVAGDHMIVIGRVVEISPEDWAPRDPLLFYKGGYRHLREIVA